MSFAFGQPTGTAASAGNTGISFGTLGGAAGTASTTSAPAAVTFSQPAANTSAAGGSALGGFSFGATPAGADSQQQKTVHFNVPGSTTTSQTTAPTLSSLLGGTGNTNPVAPTTGVTSASLQLGGTSLGGTQLGGTALGGTSLGNSGFKLGTLGTSAAPVASTSFGLPSFGSGINTTTTAGTLATTTAGVFGTASVASTAATTIQGLGGIASTCGSTVTGANKTCDAKAVKELPAPPEIVSSVDEFSKHVKTQKCVRENIARMSSKPLFRVQDDIKNLRQQLLLITSGLQRNAVAIDKLKRETALELKHSEIAQRTKDTPPGLQYENTAPSEYFQRLACDFEVQMQLYRQQIAELENHLESADRAATFTPLELSLLLGKLNEGFIALAAQLQVVHEAVKELKESYAVYRKTVFGDSSDVFDRRSRSLQTFSTSLGKTALSSTPPTTVGPTPFASMSNAAAVAMAAAMNRNQSATAPGFNLSCRGPASLGTGTQTSSLGSSLFNQSAVGSGLGLGSTGNSTFGGMSNGAQSSFGGGTFGAGNQTTGGGLFGQSPASGATGLFGAASTGFGASPVFPLAKTPIGSKRGKNA